MKISSRLLPVAGVIALASSIQAATFVVPTDRDMLQRAQLIVTGSALTSYSQLTPDGGIETVTPVSVHEVIKGKVETDTVDVVEPGGMYKGMAMVIPGVPRFTEGEEVLLLLRSTGKDRWSVADLVLGKFAFRTDAAGQKLLLRDEDEIVGWDPDMKPHKEPRRAADAFLQFVREEAKGVHSDIHYFVNGTALPLRPISSSTSLQPAPNVAPYSATSYTMSLGGGSTQGARWNVFPSGVNWFSGVQAEPGAPGGGVTAIQMGITSWNNDCGSNVNYVYAGTDNGSHTQGLHNPDGANTVLFEQDLSAWGVSPFTCSSNSYGGVLGIGGITSTSGTNVLNGETFYTTVEADVMMNRGIANCTLLFNNGDFNSAVTHELGHTLGFRHADQDRASSGACSSDPSLECSSSAIMTANITPGLNTALQTWDIHAVDAVYPGNVCAPGSGTPPPTCTPPSITSQPQATSILSGQSTSLNVGASGTTPLSYQWFIGSSGNTSAPISGATGPTLTVSPTSTTSYWVRVSNSCGSANSGTVTVSVSPAPPPPPKKRVRGDYDGDGRTDPAVYRPSNDTWYIQQSSTGTLRTVTWGSTGAIPAPADYDGDGKTDIAVFLPSSGTFSIILSSNGSTRSVQLGQNGDIPVPRDYDGDGKADVAVFRPSTGVWYIQQSSNGVLRAVQWGGSGGDIPVPADYDGDGKDDIAIENPGNGQWYIINSSNGSTRIVQWGGSGGDIPVPADYDGDGKADITIQNPGNGNWYIINSSNGSTRIVLWGGSGGDVPQPGYYDSDNKADICIFNPGAGKWYIILSANGGTQVTTLGQLGDKGVAY